MRYHGSDCFGMFEGSPRYTEELPDKCSLNLLLELDCAFTLKGRRNIGCHHGVVIAFLSDVLTLFDFVTINGYVSFSNE
ncbi:hypothetical protein VP3_0022 [Vibrio phage VP3]|uniref:Uncharacterized protein n=1 Tax=Vibrio phage VP3 TaxID=588068 RepID=H9YAH0_9CAUD|nr:hypothetical protein VP3_0022 [Vibrio phage VP3]